jgi:hypothetical protein
MNWIENNFTVFSSFEVLNQVLAQEIMQTAVTSADEDQVFGMSIH